MASHMRSRMEARQLPHPPGLDPPLPSKSTNPYRKDQAIAALPPFNFEPDKSVHTGRQHAPVRAVFNDLPTAHLSITSGSARRRAASHNISGSLDEEDSIPLQDLDSSKSLASNSPAQDVALPLMSFRDDEERDRAVEKEQATSSEGQIGQAVNQASSSQPNKHEHSTWIFSVVKKALNPSPASKIDRSSSEVSALSQWSENRLNTKLKQASKNQNEHARGKALQTNFPASKGSGRYEGHSPADSPLIDPSSFYHSNIGAGLSGSPPPGKRPIPAKHVSSYNAILPILDFQSSPPVTTQKYSVARTNARRHGTDPDNGSLLPEGSTVGNIYRHYHTSTSDVDQLSDDAFPHLNDISLESINNKRSLSDQVMGTELQPSALQIRKHRRADRSLIRYALPTASTNDNRQLLPSSSQNVIDSSSYGNTRELLQMAPDWPLTSSVMERSHGASSQQSGDLRPDWGSSPLGSNNPYQRYSRSPGPAITRPDHEDGMYNEATDSNYSIVDKGPLERPELVITRPEHENGMYDDVSVSSYSIIDRQPLEREVSKALRRASRQSTSSEDSISPSVLNYGRCHRRISSTDTSARPVKFADSRGNRQRSGSVDSYKRNVGGQMPGFYDQGAISLTWINGTAHNLVRVPIKNAESPPSPELSTNAVNLPLGSTYETLSRKQEDDPNDWETVGESAFGTEFKSIDGHNFLSGASHRAGSSIANTSDEGSDMTALRQLDSYGSTERIAQHPGNILYSGDYRQRDLKNKFQPVLLPKYQEHKVNGYLADSNRLRQPTNPYTSRPPPLDRTHVHPFSSPPPRIVSAKRTAKRHLTPFNKNAAKPVAPISLKTLMSPEISRPASGVAARKSVEDIMRTFNWLEDFGGPASMFDEHEPQLVNQQSFKPTSWKPTGAMLSGNSLAKPQDDEAQEAAQRGASRFPLPRAKGHGNTSRFRTPFVKGPPGSFYRGVSQPKRDSRPLGWSQVQNGESSKQQPQADAKKQDNKRLRPLSLLAPVRPTTPAIYDGEGYGGRLEDGFVYRSPLAPPKRRTWQELYSPQQLAEIQEAARADGFLEANASVATYGIPRLYRNGDASHMRLYETPQLFRNAQDSTRLPQAEMSKREKRLAVLVLCLCNLLPPLLFLYAIGLLDGMMAWMTEGATLHFSRRYKKIAYILVTCWAVGTVLALVAFLVFWFTNLHA